MSRSTFWESCDSGQLYGCLNVRGMQAEEVLEGEKGAGGGGQDLDDNDLDEFIDLVARANNVPVDSGTLLPELSTSPCAMHCRQLPSDRRDLDLLYSTNCHGGKVTPGKVKLTGGIPYAQDTDLTSPRFLRCSRSDYTPKGGGGGARGAGAGGGDRGWRDGKGRRGDLNKDRVISPPRGRHHQYATQPRIMAAKLPGELPPSDVIMTWLKQGSAPAGESHFPDITHPTNRIAARRRHNQSAVSE